MIYIYGKLRKKTKKSGGDITFYYLEKKIDLLLIELSSLQSFNRHYWLTNIFLFCGFFSLLACFF